MEKEINKLQFKIKPDMLVELEEISKNMGIKRTDVVKIAISKYINDYKKTQN